MKKSKYSDSQMMAILKQAEAGSPVSELCGEQSIRMVKSLTCISRESEMAQQLNASSKGYCAVMAASLGKS
jgi:putative transposase